jgi:dolichyl-phosphate beta-glucosyltransferase
MELSIVIPAYNEASRLPRSLPKILAYLKKQPFTWEVIVVDDGSVDETSQVATSYGTDVRLIRHPKNLGKGAAVRTGMLAARGEWRYLCDADLSTPIEELPKFQQHVHEADIIIGSRRAPGAQVEKSQAFWKVWLGQMGNILIQWLLVPGIKDTRCGFKLFSTRAKSIFELQQLQRFGYDDEVLFLARKKKFTIKEIPVRWVNDEQTRVTGLDYVKSLFEILQIRSNDIRGLYKT